LERFTVNIVTATMILGIVAVVGYYLTTAFIVHRTGTTAGITDLAHGTARILRRRRGRRASSGLRSVLTSPAHGWAR
jgi:hypothetical protein